MHLLVEHLQTFKEVCEAVAVIDYQGYYYQAIAIRERAKVPVVGMSNWPANTEHRRECFQLCPCAGARVLCVCSQESMHELKGVRRHMVQYVARP